jgi:hypothetical protein
MVWGRAMIHYRTSGSVLHILGLCFFATPARSHTHSWVPAIQSHRSSAARKWPSAARRSGIPLEHVRRSRYGGHLPGITLRILSLKVRVGKIPGHPLDRAEERLEVQVAGTGPLDRHSPTLLPAAHLSHLRRRMGMGQVSERLDPNRASARITEY